MAEVNAELAGLVLDERGALRDPNGVLEDDFARGRAWAQKHPEAGRFSFAEVKDRVVLAWHAAHPECFRNAPTTTEGRVWLGRAVQMRCEAMLRGALAALHGEREAERAMDFLAIAQHSPFELGAADFAWHEGPVA